VNQLLKLVAWTIQTREKYNRYWDKNLCVPFDRKCVSCTPTWNV